MAGAWLPLLHPSPLLPCAPACPGNTTLPLGCTVYCASWNLSGVSRGTEGLFISHRFLLQTQPIPPPSQDEATVVSSKALPPLRLCGIPHTPKPVLLLRGSGQREWELPSPRPQSWIGSLAVPLMSWRPWDVLGMTHSFKSLP